MICKDEFNQRYLYRYRFTFGFKDDPTLVEKIDERFRAIEYKVW